MVVEPTGAKSYEQVSSDRVPTLMMIGCLLNFASAGAYQRPKYDGYNQILQFSNNVLVRWS